MTHYGIHIFSKNLISKSSYILRVFKSGLQRLILNQTLFLFLLLSLFGFCPNFPFVDRFSSVRKPGDSVLLSAQPPFICQGTSIISLNHFGSQCLFPRVRGVSIGSSGSEIISLFRSLK